MGRNVRENYQISRDTNGSFKNIGPDYIIFRKTASRLFFFYLQYYIVVPLQNISWVLESWIIAILKFWNFLILFMKLDDFIRKEMGNLG